VRDGGLSYIEVGIVRVTGESDYSHGDLERVSMANTICIKLHTWWVSCKLLRHITYTTKKKTYNLMESR